MLDFECKVSPRSGQMLYGLFIVIPNLHPRAFPLVILNPAIYDNGIVICINDAVDPGSSPG